MIITDDHLLLLFFCSAFKHYKRAEFSNKNLEKSTVDFLDKLGVHWLWLRGIDKLYIEALNK